MVMEIINSFVLLVGLGGVVYLAFYLSTNYAELPIVDRDLIVSEEINFGSPLPSRERKQRAKWPVQVLAFFALLLGMISILAYRELSRTGFIEFSRFRVDLILTILVSPVVFLAMQRGNPKLESRTDYLIVFLVGYQNGFFWQSIFGEIAKRLSS